MDELEWMAGWSAPDAIILSKSTKTLYPGTQGGVSAKGT